MTTRTILWSMLLVASSASAQTPPANDDCSTPLVIPTNGPFPYEGVVTDVENATSSPTDMDCFDPGTPKANSLWFEWTAPAGGRYGFDTCGSDYTAFVCVSNQTCPSGPITFDAGVCSIAPCLCNEVAGSAASEIGAGETLVFMVSRQSGGPPHTLHFHLGFEPRCQLSDIFFNGSRETVLFANGGVGRYGVVAVGPNDAFTLFIDKPSAHHAPTARYLVHVWAIDPSPTDAFAVPHQIGLTCLPTFWSGLLPRPVRTANTIGHPSVLGPNDWPGPPRPPAPASLLNLPGRLRRPGLHAYFQGIVANDNFGPRSYEVTNGLRVHVSP